MAFKMKGFSVNDDIIKSKKDQIKDLKQDIIKLKSRNNPGDSTRISQLEAEIKRLQN